MIGENKNYDNIFLRNVTASLLDILEGEIYWEYDTSSGVIGVEVPFYYSSSNDERYMLDTFVDDIVSDNRLTQLNTDQTPRGMLSFNGLNIDTDSINNPNVWMKVSLEDKDEIKSVLARVKAYPITINYECNVIVANENDSFNCAEAFMNTIGIHKYFNFQYRMLNINAVMNFVDSYQREKESPINLTSKNEIKYTLNFEVKTTYPAFRKPRYLNRGLEINDNWNDSYLYDSFKKPEDEILIPKRTKWYSNIFKASGNKDKNSGQAGNVK
jgi:hypothetical protein